MAEVNQFRISVFMADGKLIAKSKWYNTGWSRAWALEGFDGEDTFEFQTEEGMDIVIGAKLKSNCMMELEYRVVEVP